MGNNSDISKIFNDLSLSAILNVVLIVVGALLLIALSQRLLSWSANKLSGAYRLYLLASVPLLRLLIIAAAIVLIIPQIVEPTVANWNDPLNLHRSHQCDQSVLTGLVG